MTPAIRFVFVVTVALLGCAYDPAAVPSRYVGDLSGLERVKPGPWDELHRRAGVDLAAYRGLRIAPVRLADKLNTQGEHYRAYDLERVRHKFDLALEQGLARSGLLAKPTGSGGSVGAVGPRLLEARAVLTGVRANRPPLDRSAHGILSTASGVGGATMQLDLVDADTGELLVAIVDRKWGVEFSANFNTNQTWGDAEDAFRWWTRTLRLRLERAGLGS